MKTDHRWKHGHAVRGRKTTPTYGTWRKMRSRCEEPTNEWYHRYGGRGIRVCRRWAKFENFLADMGVRPVGMTLDRKNVNGNYTPSNCRWATPKEQARHNHRVIDTPKGKMTLMRASEVSGLDYYTIRYRLRVGWRPERLFDKQFSAMHGEVRQC